jgi:hypothetical protein
MRRSLEVPESSRQLAFIYSTRTLAIFRIHCLTHLTYTPTIDHIGTDPTWIGMSYCTYGYETLCPNMVKFFVQVLIIDQMWVKKLKPNYLYTSLCLMIYANVTVS